MIKMSELFNLDIEVTENNTNSGAIQPMSGISSTYPVTTSPGITCQGGRNSSGCPSNSCTGRVGPCQTLSLKL